MALVLCAVVVAGGALLWSGVIELPIRPAVPSPTAYVPPPATVDVYAPGATSEPVATLPASCTDAVEYVADVTVPDGTEMAPGEAFIKTWRVRNSGTCDWIGYRFVFAQGDRLGGVLEQAVPDTRAGEEIDISIVVTSG